MPVIGSGTMELQPMHRQCGGGAEGSLKAIGSKTVVFRRIYIAFALDHDVIITGSQRSINGGVQQNIRIVGTYKGTCIIQEIHLHVQVGAGITGTCIIGNGIKMESSGYRKAEPENILVRDLFD